MAYLMGKYFASCHPVFFENFSVFMEFWHSLCSLDSWNRVKIFFETENKSLPLNYNANEKARLIKNV